MTTRAASRTARRGRERAAEGKTKARMLRGRSRRTIQMVTGPLGGATTGRAAYGELSCGVRRTAVPRSAVPRTANCRAAYGDLPCGGAGWRGVKARALVRAAFWCARRG